MPTQSSKLIMQPARLFLVSVVCTLCADPASAEPKPATLPPALVQPVSFTKDVKPILAKHCFNCHGGAKQKGGLKLDTLAAALAGGDTGPAFTTGKSAESKLIHVVAGTDPDYKMPPDGPALTPTQIGTLRAWIDQGAKYDGAQATGGVDPRVEHWSFQPIRRPPVPPVALKATVRNPIDNFLLARLAKEKITPSPEADRTTLIRRLHLDLLGLPPTPKDVDDFVKDDSPQAYEKLVDRLLASPHYGERWGRHWLDAARYADSDGYEKDTGRPNAWRFRDWVIKALNADMPFDQFTVEQLAGDLLPNATIEQRMGTGFHRNTLTNKEGGVDMEEFRVAACIDRVNTTGQVWLGLTIGCAQCHDHKYDPISQREFYQFFAFFNSDREVDIPLPKDNPALVQQQAMFEAERVRLQELIEDLQAMMAPKADVVKAQSMLAAHMKKAPAGGRAPTLALGKTRPTNVLIRGDFLRKGVEVSPGTPSVLKPPTPGASATRLELARWLTAPENPLTARVTVNWVWSRFFGRGIVSTLEDFGTQGEKPTHPELLDWLASEFRSPTGCGWSFKKLHKLIVMSAAYRQASVPRPDLLEKDPLNTLVARQARLRLEAEIVRDNALAASGLLNPTVGGPSIRPPQPAGISQLTYANGAKWVETTGPDRYKRGMYVWFQRTSPFPMLMTFDTPDSNVCSVRRERSNTPLQALTLMNDSNFVECAQALARRVLSEEKTGLPEQRLTAMFRLCLGRAPSTPEIRRLAVLLEDLTALADKNSAETAKLAGPYKLPVASAGEAAAWVAVARAILNLDEFVTRE